MRAPNKRSPIALLVEDDPAVARMLRILLRASGFEITEAAQGAEALVVLEQESPDTVILDLMLPDGQGGAVLDWLRGKGQHEAPAWVVISALDREEATTRYGPLGDHFLGKPFDPRVLLAMLRTPLSTGDGGQPDSRANKHEGATTAKGDESSGIAHRGPRRGGKATRFPGEEGEAQTKRETRMAGARAQLRSDERNPVDWGVCGCPRCGHTQQRRGGLPCHLRRCPVCGADMRNESWSERSGVTKDNVPMDHYQATEQATDTPAEYCP